MKYESLVNMILLASSIVTDNYKVKIGNESCKNGLKQSGWHGQYRKTCINRRENNQKFSLYFMIDI